MFKGQLGAVTYHTDQGDFRVLFLPKAEVFAVKPAEIRKNGRYLYTFSGSPAATGGPLDSAYPMYFVEFANQLFVANDSRVAESLERVLHSQ
jgi:hypothetical protein